MTSTDKSEPSAADPEIDEQATDDDRHLQIAVTAALDRKAEELIVLDLAKVSDFTERFLICHGANERQVEAVADAVIGKLRDEGKRPLHVEGRAKNRWVLIDYGGDMVVHVFLDELRQFYALERLWSDAPDITSRFVE
ncbi:MAG: ribosome silencing factor [bacterium]|nr:ribosome silencing factor [bacterium]